MISAFSTVYSQPGCGGLVTMLQVCHLSEMQLHC